MGWDCPECKRFVSDKNVSCVECGASKPSKKMPGPELQKPRGLDAYKVLEPAPDPPDKCDIPGCTLTPDEHRVQALEKFRELMAKMDAKRARKKTEPGIVTTEIGVGHGA